MAKDFVIEKRSEPPKFYVDEVEKSRVIEFVTYTTAIRKVGEQNERNKTSQMSLL